MAQNDKPDILNTPLTYGYEGSGSHSVLREDGEAVATCDGGCWGLTDASAPAWERAAAYAKLFAAAPEMATLLQEMTTIEKNFLINAGFSGLVNAASAALAKAGL